jgi:predicted DsbA family dithiol-disulfide isomerase
MRALEARPEHPFAISWRPFFLNPDMPPEGMDRRSYLEAKFGGKDAAAKTDTQVSEAAEAAGLSFDLSAIKRTPCTLDAHRVLHWAEAEQAQTRVVLALFRAYFEQGEDISGREALARIAGDSGLDAAVVARLLEGDADSAEVAAAGGEAARIGVTGVPTFILAGRYVVIGAQPPALWTRVIDELAAAVETSGAAP